MTLCTLRLAALAAALPGVSPVAVEQVIDRVGDRFQVGFVQDTGGERWVVRVPTDAVAAAQQEQCAELLRLLEPRLPFDVPVPAGAAALREGRRAMVHRLVPGRFVSFAGLPPGPGLAERIGEAIAAVHLLDRRVYEEAGAPVYAADECRRRHQADVTLGTDDGLVPTRLLTRWERMLQQESWWRFVTAPVHGSLRASHVLAVFDDEQDSATGQVQGVLSWEHAHVGDPAEDLATLLGDADPRAARTVLHAYERARGLPADPHLQQRAQLLGELRLLARLLRARRMHDRRAVGHATDALRALDDEVGGSGTAGSRPGTVGDHGSGNDHVPGNDHSSGNDHVPENDHGSGNDHGSVEFGPGAGGEHWYRAGAPAPAPPGTDPPSPPERRAP